MPPPLLFLDLEGGEPVEIAPAVVLHPWLAWEWVIGNEPPVMTDRTVTRVEEFTRATRAIGLYRAEQAAAGGVHNAVAAIRAAEYADDAEALRRARTEHVEALRRLAGVLDEMVENDMQPPGKPREWVETMRSLGLAKYRVPIYEPDGDTVATVEKDPTRRKTPYVVRWRDEAGKQRKRGFPRKVDADRFRAEVEHKLHTGAYVDPKAGRITFEAYAEQWRAMQPHRPNTAARTRSQLTHHVYPAIGARPLAQIRASELQAFVTGLPLSPGSVRPLWATVRAILSAAVRDRVIQFDPCDRIKLPELPRRQVTPLTVEQVDALAEAMPARYRALVVVGAATGLRQGELFGLQVADVDFLRRTPAVERQVQPAAGAAVEAGPLKNRSSYRTLPVGQVVVDALAAHLAEYRATGAAYVFRDEAGRPLHRNRFNRYVWAPARTAADLPEATCHGLRHFYASALIRAGLSVKVVSDRLGHANAAQTLGVYAHLWPDDDDRSREAIDDVFRRDVPTKQGGVIYVHAGQTRREGSPAYLALK